MAESLRRDNKQIQERMMVMQNEKDLVSSWIDLKFNSEQLFLLIE